MKKLIIAITGASGAVYGLRTLQLLREHRLAETHLIVSQSARFTIGHETPYTVRDVSQLADHVYDNRDIGAALASGSFPIDGMIVAPCSIKTLSSIAHCYSADLIARSADVCLKERRTVVLLLRETPLHPGHIHLMSQAAQSGAIIAPPVPAFYSLPYTIDDVVMHTVGRALDLFDIRLPDVKRWNPPNLRREEAADLIHDEEPVQPVGSASGSTATSEQE